MSQHAYLTAVAVFIGFVGFMAAQSPIFSNPVGGDVESGFQSPGEISSCQDNKTLQCAFDMTGNFGSLIVGGASSNPFLAVIMVALSLGVVYILADLASNVIPFT